LQVVMADAQLEALRALAQQRGTTVSDVARQALQEVTAREPTGEPARKFAAIHAAARHTFPTGDVTELLDDVERGRGSGG
jgi:hypothetical protein